VLFSKDEDSVVKPQTQFGQSSDFNLETSGFITTGAWENHRKKAKSSDK